MNTSFLEEQLKSTEKELCELLDQLDTEAVLSVAVMRLLLRSAGESFESKGDHPALLEVIARHTIPRFGANRGIIVTHQNFNQCYGLAEEYLAKRMISSLNAGNIEEAASNLDKISNSLKMQSEVVRGKAYPEQTRDRIIEIQGHFDKWFEKKIGISPSKAVEIINALVKHCESVYRENSHMFRKYAEQFKENDKKIVGFFSKLNEVIPTVLPVHLEELEIQPPISEQEGNALKKLIGISKDTIPELAQSQSFEIQRYPLYILTAGKVLLGSLSNCFDVLWDKFEEVAKNDQKFYSSRYQKYLAKWLEDKAYDYFKRIFPTDAIYKTLDYPNPDKKGTMAELDLAIEWGTFLLLVEAKAKQFRFESVRGDVGRLRTDLRENIEEPYLQATRAIRYVTSVDKSVFIERSSGRKLSLCKNSFQKIYPISLSLHHLAGVATQLVETQELGIFKDGNFPFSICIADLDLITKINIMPAVLLHYIEKRLAIQHDSQSIVGHDEINLFESYLECRLNFKNISVPFENTCKVIFGRTGKFDRLAAWERGEYPVKPDMSLSVPPLILELLRQLCARKDDGAKLIAVTLLDLDDQMLSGLSNAISKITEATIPLDTFRRISFANEEVVVTVMGSNPASSPALPALKKERLLERVNIEKYRRRLNKSIGIGILCDSTRKLIIDTVIYTDGKWGKDQDLENLVENEPDIKSVVPGSKLPNRNEPCFCGSGKKYKKCCLAKIEKMSKP